VLEFSTTPKSDASLLRRKYELLKHF